MWRGPGYSGPAAPEPMPSRVEAFLTACAMAAGRKENDVGDLVDDLRTLGEALGKGLGALGGG